MERSLLLLKLEKNQQSRNGLLLIPEM